MNKRRFRGRRRPPDEQVWSQLTLFLALAMAVFVSHPL
jgi:hypothetical protein